MKRHTTKPYARAVIYCPHLLRDDLWATFIAHMITAVTTATTVITAVAVVTSDGCQFRPNTTVNIESTTVLFQTFAIINTSLCLQHTLSGSDAACGMATTELRALPLISLPDHHWSD